MLSLSQTLAGLRSKKKFHFDVSFTLQDLVNCTYVTGVIFAKLRLKEAAVSLRYHGGETTKNNLKGHKIIQKHKTIIRVRL